MKKQKKLRKKFSDLIVAVIVLGCIFGCGCVKQEPQVGDNKKEQYENALQLMENGEYEEAAKIFASLGTYSESGKYYFECSNIVKETKYEQGMKLLEEGEKEKAYRLFANIDYNDSAERCSELLKENPSLIKTGDIIVFGKYEQDGVEENGKEPLKWLVLDVKDNKTLMITLDVVDAKDFNNSSTFVTWEKCELRSWLNSEFIANAFGEDEKAKILVSNVRASENPSNPTIDPGNDTKDKLFLLSISEARVYFLGDNLRRAKCSQYAISKGCFANVNRYGWWRLRTPGERLGRYADINSDGSIFTLGIGANGKCSGVRPAMWVTL